MLPIASLREQIHTERIRTHRLSRLRAELPARSLVPNHYTYRPEPFMCNSFGV